MPTGAHLWGQVTTRVGCHVSVGKVCHGHQFSNDSIGHGKPTLSTVLRSYVNMCTGTVARATGTVLQVYVGASRQWGQVLALYDVLEFR